MEYPANLTKRLVVYYKNQDAIRDKRDENNAFSVYDEARGLEDESIIEGYGIPIIRWDINK